MIKTRRALAGAVNMVLKRVGAQLVPYSVESKPWDAIFARWIEDAEAAGKDPNDIGDADWPEANNLDTYYLPLVRSDSVILELGPGSGRVTRRILPLCQKMILVDYSEFVCDWLTRYLKGTGQYEIHHIHRPAVPFVAANSVDMIIANGVVEHMEIDDLYWFLVDFYRVLKPSGVLSFDFDNIMTKGGLEWFQKYCPKPGARSIFRFYDPGVMKRLAEAIGYRVLRLDASDGRFGIIQIEKSSA